MTTPRQRTRLKNILTLPVGPIHAARSQTTPGRWYDLGWPATETPVHYGIVDFKPVTGGYFLPLLRLIPQHVRMSVLDGAEILGCPGLSYENTHRLRSNGFVPGSAITPNTLTLNANAWHQHLQAASQPSFWNPERSQRFWSAMR